MQLTFDLSESGLSGSPSSAADYRLLWRSAAGPLAHGGEGEGGKSASSAMQAGEFTVVGTGGSLVGDQVSFVVPASSIPDGEIALGSAGGVLPVEMTAFAAASDGVRGVRLTWTTASETNNVGWHVEVQAAPAASASTAARAPGAPELWRGLGFVAGAGTTGEARSYGYEAGSLAPGAYRFRLRQVDTDGASVLSGEVEAVAGMAGAVLLTAPSPNPSRMAARLRLTLRETQAVRAEVYDALGRRVSVLHAGEVEALRPLDLVVDAGALAPGLYVVRVTGERVMASQRLVVLR